MWGGAWGKWSSNAYFHDHYKGRRLNCLGAWGVSRLRGLIWGHRRNALVVARNVVVLAVVFSALFWLTGDAVSVDGSPLNGGIWKSLAISLRNLLPGATIVDVKFNSGLTKGIAVTEVAAGLFMLGVIASLVFRSVFDRWR